MAATAMIMPIADAIDEYVRARSNDRVVSTNSATKTVRSLYPRCEHTDNEISDLVAAAAIRRGCTVAFEQRDEDIPVILRLPSSTTWQG